MTFEERKTAAQKLVLEFLGDYREPRNMDASQLGAAVSRIADMLARRLPIGPSFDQTCKDLFSRVAERHRDYSWPKQGAFLECLPEREVKFTAPQETWKPDRLEIFGNRMQKGEGVPDAFIWGSEVDKLLRDGVITKQVLDGCRIAQVEKRKSIYRQDAEKFTVAQFGEKARPYFARSRSAVEAAE